ncbi:hypothetical protein [Sporomusa aerivorans]|uniref:hypothetical protein n=1 Tax=Sporomusa aerivorans TaxID=204936 RepID=UPI00352A4B46
MLASFDKLLKNLAEKIQSGLLPLERITKNQEIIIAQNKQIIDLLAQLNDDRQSKATGEQTDSQSSADTVSESDPSPEQNSPAVSDN